MVLLLAGLALALRRSWAWAGALLGLAVASQQFALLALVPLFVVAPARGRWRLVGGSVAAWGLVALPFVVTSRRALGTITIGTGNSPSYGGTLVRFLHLHGAPLVLVSRVLPLAVVAGLAWWMHRRLGARTLEPLPLIALMAICLSVRLVFEQNMFGYYFLALSVLLILPEIAMVVALGLIVWDAMHRRVRRYLLALTRDRRDRFAKGSRGPSGGLGETCSDQSSASGRGNSSCCPPASPWPPGLWSASSAAGRQQVRCRSKRQGTAWRWRSRSVSESGVRLPNNPAAVGPGVTLSGGPTRAGRQRVRSGETAGAAPSRRTPPPLSPARGTRRRGCATGDPAAWS